MKKLITKQMNMDQATGNVSAPTTPQTDNQRPATFGEKLAGCSFNPSNDSDVDKVKRAFADLADMVNDHKGAEQPPSYLYNLIKGNALRELLNAQMNVVKLITLKY